MTARAVKRGPLILISAAAVEALIARAPCEYCEYTNGLERCGRESSAMAVRNGAAIVVCSDHAERIQSEEEAVNAVLWTEPT